MKDDEDGMFNLVRSDFAKFTLGGGRSSAFIVDRLSADNVDGFTITNHKGDLNISIPHFDGRDGFIIEIHPSHRIKVTRIAPELLREALEKLSDE